MTLHGPVVDIRQCRSQSCCARQGRRVQS
jgi:hypothetical protein